MLTTPASLPDDGVSLDAPSYALAPIAGLQMKEREVIVGDQRLIRCSRASWERFEADYIVEDWLPEYYRANPVFMCRQYDELVSDDQLLAAINAVAEDATRVVTACRLYKSGALLEPLYTVVILVRGEHITRRAAPYRVNYFRKPLTQSTWQLEAGDADELTTLYRDLKVMEQTPGTDALSVAIRHYNLSYTGTITDRFCAHLLFTAQEMLFDGLPKRLALTTTRYDRAHEMARCCGLPYYQGNCATLYDDQVHRFRESVHHHTSRGSSFDPAKTAFCLRLPVAAALRVLIRLHRPETCAALSALAQARGWQGLNPRALLNACLDRRTKGDPAPMQELLRATGMEVT